MFIDDVLKSHGVIRKKHRPNVTIETVEGVVTVTIPTGVTVSERKWSEGQQDIIYFRTNGTAFTGNTFNVTVIGTYTVYIKDNINQENVYVFEVTENMLPIVTTKPVITVNSLPIVHGTVATYSVSLTVFDSSSRIVKYKSPSSSTYTPLATPVEAGVSTTFNLLQDIDFNVESNREVEYVFGYENEKGQSNELVLYADQRYIYAWSDDVMALLTGLTGIEGNFTNAQLSLPSLIQSRRINQVGQIGNSIFANNTVVKTLTIPLSVENLYPLFYNSSLTRVNVRNSKMNFLNSNTGNTPFESPNEIISFQSAAVSTTKDFVDSSDNPNFTFLAV